MGLSFFDHHLPDSTRVPSSLNSSSSEQSGGTDSNKCSLLAIVHKISNTTRTRNKHSIHLLRAGALPATSYQTSNISIGKSETLYSLVYTYPHLVSPASPLAGKISVNTRQTLLKHAAGTYFVHFVHPSSKRLFGGVQSISFGFDLVCGVCIMQQRDRRCRLGPSARRKEDS